jgi:hypothetical protein
MWLLWKEQNSRTFEDAALSYIDLESIFFHHTLYFWSQAWGFTQSLSLLDFTLSL